MPDGTDAAEVYGPIPEQVEKLVESCTLADPATVEGIRLLIEDGVASGFFSSCERDGLARKLQVAEALCLLEQEGIVRDK